MSRAVREYFDRNVREWDTGRYVDPTYIGRARHALRWLRRLGPEKVVLDLGCGTGRQSAEAIQAGNIVVSTDFSLEMARATRDRIARDCPGARSLVIVSDAMHPPFADGAFDAVMALGLVGFVDDRPALLRKVHALLRPGGILVCDVGVPEEQVLFPSLARRVDRLVSPLWRLGRRWLGRETTEGESVPPAWYRQNFVKHAPARIESMLQAAGFQPDGRAGAGFGELRVLGRLILPWRVSVALTSLLNAATTLPGGQGLARRALTYVLRSSRVDPPGTASHAPALGSQLPG